MIRIGPKDHFAAFQKVRAELGLLGKGSDREIIEKIAKHIKAELIGDDHESRALSISEENYVIFLLKWD